MSPKLTFKPGASSISAPPEPVSPIFLCSLDSKRAS